MSAVFCSVCGGPSGPSAYDWDPDYQYDRARLTEQDQEWLMSFYPINETSFPEQERLNSRTTSGASFALYDAANAEGWDPSIGWEKIAEGDAEDAFYPIHEACVRITEHIRRLRLFGDGNQVSPKAVLIDFVETLKRLHYRIGSESGVRFDHGFYGAGGFQLSNGWIECLEWEVEFPYDSRSSSADEFEQWLCADPMEIPSLTPWILSRLQKLPAVPPNNIDHKSPPYATEAPLPALDGLPFDILTQIASYLPTKSVLFLRRCNQSLATRINLDQSFWRDRLISGSLVDFIWDMDEAQCRQKDQSGSRWDWRCLARDLRAQRFPEAALRRSLQSHIYHDEGGEEERNKFLGMLWQLADRAGDTDIEGAPLGLLNRCRIVRVVEEFERIKEEEIRDSQIPLSKEEEIYANMWIVAVSWPDQFDEYIIKRSLELYGNLHGVLNGL